MSFNRTRRRVLQSLGIAAAGSTLTGLGFAPEAAAAQVPRRLIVFYTIGGVDFEAWDPEGTPEEWRLSAHLAPLAPFKDKLSLITNLDSHSFSTFGFTGTGGHETRAQHALSAWPPGPNAKPGGVSFDNHIAEKLRAQGQMGLVEHAYLQPNANAVYHDHNLRPSVRSNGAIRNPLGRPDTTLATLFPANEPSAATMDAAARSAYLQDFLFKEYKLYATAGAMDASSRRRFSDHLDRLGDLGRRLKVGGRCQPPHGLNKSDTRSYNAWIVQTAAAALACDSTRVLLIDMAWDVNPFLVGGLSEFSLPPDLNTIHELGHRVHAPEGPLRNNPAARKKLLESYTIQQVEPLARLLTALDAVEEADGKTLLDHSCVLWCNESSDGDHKMTGFRYLLAGSAGGRLRTGRWLKMQGESIADVWATVAVAMGVEWEGIANPVALKGPMSALLA